ENVSTEKTRNRLIAGRLRCMPTWRMIRMTVDPSPPTDGARVGDSVDAAFSVVRGGAGSRTRVGGAQAILFPLSVFGRG
ncbi:unnamed protein product, partial [Musa acuminata var. zebrina]